VDSAEADLVLVVCGCPVSCAAHADLRGRLGKLVLTSEGDYAATARRCAAAWAERT
jgi:hypothetical protein